MILISFTPSFLRQMKAVPREAFESIYECIELLKKPENHKKLKVHKLHGRLKGRFSFSVNYRTRIVFMFGASKKEVVILAIGDHHVYE